MCPGTSFGSFQWSVLSYSLETYWTRSGARQMPAVDVTRLYIHLQTPSTDHQHLIFHELCPAAAIVYLAFRHCSHEHSIDSYLEQDQCHLLPLAAAFYPGYVVQWSKQGALSGTQTMQGMSLSFVGHVRYQYGLLGFYHLPHFQQWLVFILSKPLRAICPHSGSWVFSAWHRKAEKAKKGMRKRKRNMEKRKRKGIQNR